jgi:hypothetical protein
MRGQWLESEADASGFQIVARYVAAGSCSLDAAWCGFAAGCRVVDTAAIAAASAVRYASWEESPSAARCTQTQVVATKDSLGQALAGNLIPQRLPSDISLDCAGVDTGASNGLKRFGIFAFDLNKNLGSLLLFWRLAFLELQATSWKLK